MNRIFCRVVVGVLAWAPIALAQDSPFIRVVDPDAQTTRLEVAVRTLVPDGPGPVVRLVGAVHIGDSSFYRQLQAWLDAHDIVLYEGVGGPRDAIPAAEESAALRTTEHRLRLVGALAEQRRLDTGRYPSSSSQIADAYEGATRAFVAAAFIDGWGNPMQLEVGERFEAISFGADGAPGGDGDDADRRLSGLPLFAPAKPQGEEAKGLQRDLAHALGLEFQLDGIDYTQPHWRNSDLSVEQIRAALAGDPVPPRRAHAARPGEVAPPAPTGDRTDAEKAADVLFGALSGDSFLAKSMGFLVRMMGSSAQGRAMIKIVLADTLVNADAILQSQAGALGDLMKVLTEDRNKQVVDDLRELVRDEPGVGSVAVFYGAGHFADLEARVCRTLGYRSESTIWIPAITVDVAESGLGAEQVKAFRAMMHKAIEQQLRKAD